LVDEWPACGMNWPPDLPDIYQYLRVRLSSALHGLADLLFSDPMSY
jgi:carboxypeptidase D